jgi:tripartite-type tricarboxylate transporter receptor subunit TctC
MKFPRRQLLYLAAGVGALVVALRVVRADTYPSRPVRFIVAFPAGNASDVLARLMGQGLSDRLAQKLVVENRPGAGSNVGTEVVARAPPDGYTLLLITPSNAINKTLYEKLNFDFINDIAPIASICQNPYVMAVTPSFPAKTVPEFIAYARSNPGKINMAV